MTPFGTIYATNITPDRDSGIGNYSLTDFARAVRLGVRPDGTRLYPAMPYSAYAKMSDEDLQDLFAYLQKDITPVSQTAPANTLKWPFDMRWPMAFWNVVFLDGSQITPDASKDAQWNRGAYLVEGLEHCGECHTPRHVTQSLNNSQKFAGAVAQGWMAYNITGDKQSGIGGWSDAALTSYLTTGHADGHSSASGPMAEAIVDSLRYLTPRRHPCHRRLSALDRSHRDRASAIAQNPPAAAGAAPPAGPRRASLRRRLRQLPRLGRQAARNRPMPRCSAAGRSTILHATNLMAILLSGSNIPLPAEHVFMPPFGHGHSDDELAAVGGFRQRLFRQRHGQGHRRRCRQGAEGRCR